MSFKKSSRITRVLDPAFNQVRVWIKSEQLMVFISDGCSIHHAHIWSKSVISICWRNLVPSKESSNPIFFSEKTYSTLNMRNMFWATILHKHHGFDFLWHYQIWKWCKWGILFSAAASSDSRNTPILKVLVKCRVNSFIFVWCSVQYNYKNHLII